MVRKTKYTKLFYNNVLPSDWEVKSLIEVATYVDYRGKTPTKTNSGRFLVTAKNIRDGFIDYEISQEFISVKDFELVMRRGLPKLGDILITTEAPLGSVALIDREDIALAQRVIKYRVKEDKANNLFLFQYLLSDRFQLILDLNSTGSTAKGIKGSVLHKLNVPLPPLPEQKAIARVLSTWDEAIHTTEKFIAQKELRKKWLMQKLLTGRKRLKGFENTKWKIQPLESFIKPIVREVPKPDVPYLGIGLRSHGKGTFLKHDEQPEKNSMDKFYVVRPNDLIVNITFAWEQAIAIVRPEDDGALASHRFPTYTFIEEKGHPDFFRFYILQPRMKFMLEMISPGGAGRNRVMSKSDFIKLEFLLPVYKEQTAIAQVLQAAEKEINLLKAKVEKLREQKRGLMQDLLTGRVRLKI